jgi:hypothetical protein
MCSLPQSIIYATFTSIQFFLCFFACSLASLFTRVPVCWCVCSPAFSTTCLNSGSSRLVAVAIGRHAALLRLAASALGLLSLQLHLPLPSLFASCPLSACPLSAVRCPLSAVRCPLSAVCCPLSAVRCPLSAVHCPLSAVLLFAVCCPLSAVLCPLSPVPASYNRCERHLGVRYPAPGPQLVLELSGNKALRSLAHLCLWRRAPVGIDSQRAWRTLRARLRSTTHALGTFRPLQWHSSIQWPWRLPIPSYQSLWLQSPSADYSGAR